MRTLILPGYSPQNREWALAVQQNFKHPNDCEVVIWKHWETGSPSDFSAASEALNVLAVIGKDKVNVIAKSIGTLVAMYVVAEDREKIKRMVLCGIPLGDIDVTRRAVYSEALKNFNPKHVLVVQNETDTHGSYQNVEQLIHEINKDIKVVAKPGSTHEYPYFEDINRFL
jgi:pimeloyl-ACP methyl ester carboxylesterase